MPELAYVGAPDHASQASLRTSELETVTSRSLPKAYPMMGSKLLSCRHSLPT